MDFSVSSASFLSSHLVFERLLKSVNSLRCSNRIWKYFLTAKSLFSKYRLQIRASVGVCTLPREYTPRPAEILNACEALIPTSQSALLRPCPALYSPSKSLPAFKLSKPCLIAFSVSELIHRRSKGFRHFRYS